MKHLTWILVALLTLILASGKAFSQSDWSFVPVDPDEAGFDLLGSADKRVFGDKPTPLWAVLSEHTGPAALNDSCYGLSALNGSKRKLRSESVRLNDYRQLTFHLEKAMEDLSNYGLSYSIVNRFMPPPATIHLPEFSSLDRAWTGENLIFCDLGVELLYERPTLFKVALGAWEHPSYSGWNKAKYIKVRPDYWNELEQDNFSKQFQATFGLARQYDYFMHGITSSSGEQQINDWGGTMGLLPAIALIEAESAFDIDRGAYDDPKQRYKYMPMQLHFPFTAYHSRRYEGSPVDEEKFSSMALWWAILTELADDIKSDPIRLEILMADRYEGEDFLYSVDRFIDEYDEEEAFGLTSFFPVFAAAYANWPETIFDGKVDEDLWLEESFGGCEKLEVTERSPVSAVTISLQEDTAQCIEIALSATAQAYTGTMHTRFYSEKRIIKDLNIAMSKAPDGKLCKNEHIKGVECLITPPQADLEGDQAARFFSAEYVVIGNGERKETRLIVSRVPRADKRRQEFGIIGNDDVDIVVSLEVATLDSPLPVSDAWATMYGSKRGSNEVGPPGDSESANPEDAIFNRSMGTSRAILEIAAEGGQAQIGLMNEVGDEIGFILADPYILSSMQTGTFPATANMSYADDDVYTLQDPQKESEIRVLEHSELTLRFEGTANLCFIRRSDENVRQKGIVREGIRIGLIKDLEARDRASRELEKRLKLDDPCGAAFKRAPIKVTGAIPFPKTWTKDGMLKTWVTDGYLKLRDLRASRIRRAMSGSGFGSGAQGGNSSDSSRGAGGSSTGGSGSGEGDRNGVCQAPIYRNQSGCSCTCEAKSCLGSKMISGTATASEKGCRLFCGADWAQCP